jgi:protein FAM50
MDSPDPNSASPSRSSTPNAAGSGRFTGQKATAEDLLKSQTVGLVQLSDFRKRRAEALEQTEREAQDRIYGRLGASKSGSSTPRDG